jgi:hypothetical protein
MKVNIIFECLVRNYNGSMHVDILDQQQLLYSGQNLKEGILNISIEVTWPTQLTIITSNKHDTDTENDDDGNIIGDKSIEVTGILINNFPIQIDLVDQLFNCQWHNSKEVTHENYLGLNGTVTIDFDKANPMRYFLELKNQFDMNRLQWDNHG